MRVRIKSVANPPYTSANTTQPIYVCMYTVFYIDDARRKLLNFNTGFKKRKSVIIITPQRNIYRVGSLGKYVFCCC